MIPNLSAARSYELTHIGQRAGADEGDPQVSLVELFGDGTSDMLVYRNARRDHGQ